MNPPRFHRVSKIVLAFLLLNAGFMISGVAQKTVVAAASGYVPGPTGRMISPKLYYFQILYGDGIARWIMNLSGLVWIAMFAFISLIAFREFTGRRYLRGEPILWWAAGASGCILSAGLASYLHGYVNYFHLHYRTNHFHPSNTHFIYPFGLILFACIGLKTFRTRAVASVKVSGPHADVPPGNGME